MQYGIQTPEASRYVMMFRYVAVKQDCIAVQPLFGMRSVVVNRRVLAGLMWPSLAVVQKQLCNRHFVICGIGFDCGALYSWKLRHAW